MKRTGITLFAIFVLAVFAGTIFYFVNSIHTDYKNGIIRSEQTFSQLAETAENEPEKFNISLFANNEGILSGKFSRNNATIIAYPDEETSTEVSNSGLVKIFNRTIVKNNDTYELKVAFYLLRPAVIYKSAKNSFILILSATLITIAVLIYISAKDGKNKTEESEYDEDSAEAENAETEYSEEDAANENSDNEFSAENISEQTFPETEQQDESFDFTEINSQNENEDAFPQSKETSESSDFSEKTEEMDFSAEKEQNNYEESDKIDEQNDITNTENTEESNSEAYYNEQKVMEPASEAALNSEENKKSAQETLKEKINYEITKAASNETDLSLFLVKFENAPVLNIKKYLEDNFGKDNTFIYEENTFALIKEDTTVDAAEDIAAKTEQELKSLYPETKTFIGISSRSIRILSADRLLMEAEEALKHTSDDEDSHIIGFHVDIEKYRELLKNS